MSEPVIAQRGPYGVEVEAGKTYWWCRCGRSGNQPFCDGSHKDTDFTPVKYTAEASKKVFFCGCIHRGNMPLCDGSHDRLE
ncbi:MAG: CDGSH iron-sulfur domain-containing protein [Candidatus Competibacterales bacterium]|nr:CDGSH iron-sulfur domain-containing protein [Candidatus Competibacterales bacterium]